jgi:hypothetical protein
MSLTRAQLPVRLTPLVGRESDGAGRIAADAWQAGPELPAEGWLSPLPDAGTTVRSD